MRQLRQSTVQIKDDNTIKHRIFSIFLAAMMLLSAVAGLAGCSSGNGSVYGKVSPDSEKKIGNAKRNGVEIVIPAGTFENGDKIYILIGFVGGNNTISTAYEYKWHS